MSNLQYQSGFANEFATEAVAGALPKGQNSPQKSTLGLYTEQFSGTPFTAPRATNRRAWLYRIRPSVTHRPFVELPDNNMRSGPFDEVSATPNQLRWDPLPIPSTPCDFLDGIITIAGNGGPAGQTGCAVHIYAANQSMSGRFFANADGEMLVLPQLGKLRFFTEQGILEVAPGELCVFPAGSRCGLSYSTSPPAAISARTTVSPSACLTLARSALTGWRTRAIFFRRWRRLKTWMAISDLVQVPG